MPARVFVVQDRGHNYIPAKAFGELVQVFAADRQVTLFGDDDVNHAREVLFDFRDDDHILAVGDPTLIGICCALAAFMNHGRLKVLKWDRQENIYLSQAINCIKEPAHG